MTWAPAIDVENASAHASKVSISFNEGILIVTSSRNLPLAATEDIPSFCLKTMGTKVAQEPSAACSRIVGNSYLTGLRKVCSSLGTNRPGVRSGHISGFDVPEISVVDGVDFNRAE